MNIPDSECPVPIDQRPINEYNTLKDSTFFLWTTRSLDSYIKNVFFLSIPIYFFIGSLVKASTMNSELPLNDLLYTVTFSTIILGLIFLRIYLGWTYVYQRLVKASVNYEESGWYDGKTWIKPPEILIQDKLIAKYQLLPIINRLKVSLIVFFSVCSVILIYLKWVE
jgi:hypothetical protein